MASVFKSPECYVKEKVCLLSSSFHKYAQFIQMESRDIIHCRVWAFFVAYFGADWILILQHICTHIVLFLWILMGITSKGLNQNIYRI